MTGCGQEATDTHPEQWVTKRKAVFKQMTKTLEPIGMVARGRKDYNPREFNAAALDLQKLASQPWPFFTGDSNYPPTRAKAAVWENPAEFKQAQDKFQLSVSGLVQASQGNDLDAIKTTANAVESSCKSCHDQFRNNR
jgi:cytochrome c556